MKYIFLSLLLISSITFCIESIYEEISDLSNPTKKDYSILQNYLLLGSRPYLSWLNKYIKNPNDGFRYDLRVRNFQLIKEREEPLFKIVYFNSCSSNRDMCIISYASFNNFYPKGAKRLEYRLQKTGFKGHYIYRIGGWPDLKGGSLLLAHVPYSFKICMFKEALSYGYKKILWLDTSFIPLQNLSPLFKSIEEKGYLIASDSNKFSHYINEKILEYFNLTFEDSEKVQAIAAGLIGFDFTNKNAQRIFNNWSLAASELQGFLSSRPEQNALAAVLYKLNLAPTCNLADVCAWKKEDIQPYHLLFISHN